MSTIAYPTPRPLIDPTGHVAFPITHIGGVIDGVSKSNPNFTGPIKINGTVVFDIDPATKKPKPLSPDLGGSGQISVADLAKEVAKALGYAETGVVAISKGGTGATTAAAALTALGGTSAKRFQVDISTGWSGSSAAGYTKTVTVTGMLATDVPIVGIILPTDLASAKNQASAFSNVSRIVANNNNVVLYAYNTAPSIAFTLQFLCIRGFT